MIIQEKEQFNITRLPEFLVESGLSELVPVSTELVSVNGDLSRRQLRISGPEKTFFVDSNNGLDQIEAGRLGTLIKRLAKAAETAGNYSALDLLTLPIFTRACLDEVAQDQPLQANPFLRQAVPSLSVDTIPVFYGSTCGINFGEALEVASCSEFLRQKGLKSSPVFDYEAGPHSDTLAIIGASMNALPRRLRSKVLDYYDNFNSSVVDVQIKATQELIGSVQLPQPDFVSDDQIFEQLSGEFRYTLAQLLLIAAIEGGNPQIFKTRSGALRASDFLVPDETSLGGLGITEYFSRPVAGFIKDRVRATGITYYGRYARIGQFGGVLAAPFHLTEKANIYKILQPLNVLFNPQSERGFIILPVSRQWIQSERSKFGGEPFDAVALKLLAQDQPMGFQKLMADFQSDFQVYSPAQATARGFGIRRYFIESYFNLEEEG